MSQQKLPMKDRLKKMLDDYGPVGLVIYFGIFASTLVGFYMALSNGVDLRGLFEAVGMDYSGVAAETGTLVVAWAATKLTQPLRIFLSLAVTPWAGRWYLARKGVEI